MPTGPGGRRRKTSPVLLLKTKSTPHDGYEEFFSTSSLAGRYEPRFIPVLEHKFHDANLAGVRELCLSGALWQRYGGLIFTSQRAVEGFAGCIRDIQCACPGTFTLYSVGPATHRALVTLRDAHLPQAQVIGEHAGTGEELASIVLEHYNNDNKQKNDEEEDRHNASCVPMSSSAGRLPLLFLVGEQHRDVIPKTLMSPDLQTDRRIGVEELTVYETGVMESFETVFVGALKEAGAWQDPTKKEEKGESQQSAPSEMTEIGSAAGEEEREKDTENAIWVVVFSPTGCDILVKTLNLLPSDNSDIGQEKPKLERNCYIATIGPTTRDHLRSKFGIEADVCAERPSPESLGSGIETFMARRKKQRENKRILGK